MKKIIHFSSWARTFTQFRFEILSELKRAGYDNIIICSHESPHSEILLNNGHFLVEDNFSPKIDKNLIPSILKLRKYLNKYNVDYICLHQPIALLIGVIAKIGLKKNIIYFTGGLKTNDSMSRLKKRIVFFIELRFLKRCSLVLSVNKHDCLIANKSLGDRIVYVGPRGGCGINTEIFRYRERDKYELRKQLNIPHDDVVIGLIGRIELEKGIFEILKAFSKLNTDIQNTHLLIIGSGSQNERLSKEIDQLGIASILFLGRKENIERWYSCLDVFILSSRREGMPTSLLEAMSAENLVMATNVRGANEVVKHGVNGFIYRDVDDLCNNLQNILLKVQDLGHIRKQAREDVVTLFSSQVLLPKTMHILSKHIENVV